jgi:hypothetical protein
MKLTQYQSEITRNPATTADGERLQDLGRACVEIVHDARNELNALKLYATFLQRRSEEAGWPADERETLAKILVGLERAACDLTMLVRYSRPIEPVKRAGIDLREIVCGLPLDAGLCSALTGDPKESLVAESDVADFSGSFDPVLMTEALKAITLSAIKLRRQRDDSKPLRICLRREESGPVNSARIEWQGVGFSAGNLVSGTGGMIEVRVSLAEKIVAAHHGIMERNSGSLAVRLPLTC